MWWRGDVNSQVGDKLYEISVKHSLTQVIHEPTRITLTSKSCLDLLFCNSPGMLSSQVISPISGSDHSTIYAQIDMTLDYDINYGIIKT
jgi:hypothetical protein